MRTLIDLHITYTRARSEYLTAIEQGESIYHYHHAMLQAQTDFERALVANGDSVLEIVRNYVALGEKTCLS